VISFRTQIRKDFLSYLQFYYSDHSNDYKWNEDINKTEILIADRRPTKMIYPAIISVAGRFSRNLSIGDDYGEPRIDGTRDSHRTYNGNIYLKVFSSNEIESDTIACNIEDIFGNYGNLSSFIKNSEYINQISEIIINKTSELKTEPMEYVTIVWFKIMSHFIRRYKLVDSSVIRTVNVTNET